MSNPKNVLGEVVAGLFGIALYASHAAHQLKEKIEAEKHKRKKWTEEQKQLQILAGIRDKNE